MKDMQIGGKNGVLSQRIFRECPHIAPGVFFHVEGMFSNAFW